MTKRPKPRLDPSLEPFSAPKCCTSNISQDADPTYKKFIRSGGHLEEIGFFTGAAVLLEKEK
jgi:hypothetical protein